VKFQEDYALKSSMLGKVAAEQLIDQEKVNKQLSQESKELKRNFTLAQAANLNLEKKVAELAEALKRCQDEKKAAEEALDRSKKDLEKLEKTHDDDLRSIENLRKDHDKSLKTAEDLRTNNADLAKSLSSKERRIQDLERALTEQREASGRNVSDIISKLKILFEEYKRSLNEFGVHPAPLPADLGLPEFLEWIDAEFKALPEVISGANDFAAAFSVESILKLLHDFDCADLVKFREKLPQFPDAMSTSRLRPNEDVQAIRSKFAREFWLASRKEAVKNIARAKLAQVGFLRNSCNFCEFTKFFLFFLYFFLCFPQLIEEEKQGRGIAHSESSSEDNENEESSDSGKEDSGDSSDDGSDGGHTSEHEEDSSEVDITG
jgi:predicted  nucleic acid-binding Zn-ribbon protein